MCKPSCNSSKSAPYAHPPGNIPSSLVGASRNATKAQTNISSASTPPSAGPCFVTAPRRKSIPKIIAEALFGVRRTSKRALRAGSCRLHLAVGLLGGTAPVGDGCYAVAHCLVLWGWAATACVVPPYGCMLPLLPPNMETPGNRKIDLFDQKRAGLAHLRAIGDSLHLPV